MMSWGTDKLNFTIMNLKKTVLFAKIATVLWLLVSIFYFVGGLKELSNIDPRDKTFSELQIILSFVSIVAVSFLLCFFSSVSGRYGVFTKIGLAGSLLLLIRVISHIITPYFIDESVSLSYWNFLPIIGETLLVLSFYMIFLFQKRESTDVKVLKTSFLIGLLWSIYFILSSFLDAYTYYNFIIPQLDKSSMSFIELIMSEPIHAVSFLASFIFTIMGILYLLFFAKLLRNTEKVAGVFREEYNLNLKFNEMKKKGIFTIIGGVLGLPLSYYFQSDYIREKVGGIGGYIQHFGDILKEQELLNNVLIAVVVFAVVGFVIGYFVDKADAQEEA